MKLFDPHAQAGGKTRRNGAQKTAVWGLRRARKGGMMKAKPARGRRALRGKACRGGM